MVLHFSFVSLFPVHMCCNVRYIPGFCDLNSYFLFVVDKDVVQLFSFQFLDFLSFGEAVAVATAAAFVCSSYSTAEFVLDVTEDI